jgi:hypothetical protein
MDNFQFLNFLEGEEVEFELRILHFLGRHSTT